MKIAHCSIFINSIFLSGTLPLILLGCTLAAGQTPAKSGSSVATAAAAAARVTDAAVWNPAPDVLASMRAKCGEADSQGQSGCFLSEMKLAGASPEAIGFSKSLAATGAIYLRAFRKVARIDVAYIQYVFRANEREGVLLVNGDPSPIDVDDETQFPETELQKYAPYAALASKFPQISIWPADRVSSQFPKLDSTGWATQSFQVDYILRDGCHACAQIGTTAFAFNFDSQGKFQGTRILSVKPAARELESSGAQEFGTAGVEQIRVLAGKEFSITLVANHTTGYSWRLATALDRSTLKPISDTYTEPDAQNFGASGEEIWTFATVGQGTAELVFEYARPTEKDAKPIKTAKFLVRIE